MPAKNSPHTWSNSAAYEAFMGRWSRIAADEALRWLALPPGLRWIEIGCGTGALTEAILANADPVEILGIDPSPDFLAQAAKRIQDKRVTFRSGSAEDLDAPNDHYDIAITGLVLHFIDDPRQSLAAMTRTVRPGGTVAGYIWDVASEEQFTSPFWRAAESLDPGAKAWEPLYRRQLNSVERVTELFTNALLAQVTVATLDFPVLFRDFTDYWEPCLLDGSAPVQQYIQTLSQDQQAALRERLREQLPTAPDGSIPLHGRLWIVQGTKLA